MTNKKPSLIAAGEAFIASDFESFEAEQSFKKALARAKEREALVEAVVKAARCPYPITGPEVGVMRNCGACVLCRALAALDRFDAGEGK